MSDRVLYIFLLILLELTFGFSSTILCSTNGNRNCSILPTNTLDSTTDLHIHPENFVFSYYFKTSPKENNLDIKGILKWNIPFKSFESIKSQSIGFRIKIIEKGGNREILSKDIQISKRYGEDPLITDVLEIRIEISDILKFGNQYESQLFTLPIKNRLPTISTINIPKLVEKKNCTEMKDFAGKWAPSLIIDVYETTSEIHISWLPAPNYLCIQSYDVVTQNRNGSILEKRQVQVDHTTNLLRAVLYAIPRNYEIMVKVRATLSTDGQCACSKCNCIIDKSRFFTIPNPDTVAVLSPSINLSFVKLETTENPYIKTALLMFAITLIFIIFFAVILLYSFQNTRKYQAILVSKNPEKEIETSKECRILLVCSNGSEDQNRQISRICQGFKESSNFVVCDKFVKYSHLAEENLLQWTYSEVQLANKIVILHSNNHRGSGVYGILTSMVPFSDSRLIHIHLSPNPQKRYSSEVQYIFPRDQRIIEQSFNIIIPENLPNEYSQYLKTSLDSDNRIFNDSNIMDNKTSIDSGVESFSSNNFKEKLQPESLHQTPLCL